MAFAFEDDQFCAGNGAREVVRRCPMGAVRRSMIFVVADQNKRWHCDVPQARRVIVLLARQHEMKVILERRDAGHAHAQKFFDQRGILGGELLGPPGFDGVLADVIFEALAHHVAAHGERNAVRSGVRGATGGENQLFDLSWIVESQKLRDHAAHGMAADDGLFGTQMIEQRRGVVGEHFDRIFLHRFARFAGAAIVEHDDFMVAGKFRDLVELPGLVVETGDVAKQKRRAFAVDFVVDLRIR